MNTGKNKARIVTGNVLKIERASIHDGRGLRTVVFLKGCPMKCTWCSTPESQLPALERGYVEEACSGCLTCVRSCPHSVLSPSEPAEGFRIQANRSLCRLCFHCADGCPAGAIRKYGTLLSLEEAMEIISRDEVFFFYSGGGVTLSGGEPLAQADFTAGLLRESKLLGIHTAMESCMYAGPGALDLVLPWLDHLYADIKHMDTGPHLQETGETLQPLLDNITRADRSGGSLEITVRIPLIPGYNDSEDNLAAVVEFCRGLGRLQAIEVLPYHRLGVATYRHLDRKPPIPRFRPPENNEILERIAFMQSLEPGLKIISGSGISAVPSEASSPPGRTRQSFDRAK